MAARIMTDLIQRIDASSLPGGEADEAFLRALGRPTWIDVPGRDRSRSRVVTTLLHGNEPSGTRAMRAWLASDVKPAVDLHLFICSVETALSAPPFSHRFLPGRRDVNRCFAGPFDDPDGALAGEVLGTIEATHPEALIDIHNNTGHSPAYGVGTLDEPHHLGLTGLFADRYMLSDLRLGTLVEATERAFPSVVVECGRAGDLVADAVALAGLERFASIEDLDQVVEAPRRVEVLEHPVRVLLVDGVELAFGDEQDPRVDLTVRTGIDRHNFAPIERGTLIGWCADRWPIDARGRDGKDRSHELFEQRGSEIRTRRAMVPVMMTGSAEVAKSDCLFYAMSQRNR